LIIVGGGFIACEFAAIFAGLGSQVTLLVRGDQLMKHMDDDLVAAFNEHAAQTWQVEFGAEVVGIEQDATGSLSAHTADATFAADAVLFATGRTPNTDTLGAAEAG